ncbi:MAG: LamG-like jellyroll fold domain-containing protein [Pirellulaceae bacterium]
MQPNTNSLSRPPLPVFRDVALAKSSFPTAVQVFVVLLVAAGLAIAVPCVKAQAEHTRTSNEPQLITSARLLQLGEELTFSFIVPPGVQAGSLEVFARYLESANPGADFRAGRDLEWLEALPRETFPVQVVDGHGQLTYRPATCGSYLARWRAGDEVFVRYFAAIEDDWVVLRFSSFADLEPDPTLHATGIPLDYRLPGDRFRWDDPLLRKFRAYHRHFGETIIPALPDTPTLTLEERVAMYGEVLERVRTLMPDPSNARAARVDMRHERDPGYSETLMRLGVNDHCGLQEANAKPWLGMPEFPYFASLVDCRMTNQDQGGTLVAHQWDFCGGWHFIGPVSWHYKAAAGEWARAENCVRAGVEELANLAELSGHPAFAVPLYDGVVGPGYPNPAFWYAVAESRGFRGDMRDVFVTQSALDDLQIRRVMSEGPQVATELWAAWSVTKGHGEDVPDSSGHAHDGRLLGAAEWMQDERGAALRLDGKSCVVTDVPPWGEGDFTLGCWVRPAAEQMPWANLISSHNNRANADLRGVSLEQDGVHANRFYLLAGDGARWMGTSLMTQLEPNLWQHFAVVRRGQRVTHYLNGKVSADGEVLDKPIAPATDPLRIGDWARGLVDPERSPALSVTPMRDFVERYQRLVAFELPKQYRLAFARSIDVADYYRRHFPTTPRTVFVSQTDHVRYDMWWLCSWCNDAILVPRQEIPWETRMSSVYRLRETVYPFKDPLSHEYVLVEDQRRSIRFERECPNPIWWFDYTQQERGPEGSSIAWTVTPDVEVLRSGWREEMGGQHQTLTMQTSASFDDYAIAIWRLPVTPGRRQPVVETNAKEAILARNRDGEWHAILVFDLRPDTQLRLTVRAP